MTPSASTGSWPAREGLVALPTCLVSEETLRRLLNVRGRAEDALRAAHIDLDRKRWATFAREEGHWEAPSLADLEARVVSLHTRCADAEMNVRDFLECAERYFAPFNAAEDAASDAWEASNRTLATDLVEDR